MATTTTNYSFTLPGVADPVDSDLWGGQLNGNWTSIDSLLLTASNAVSRTESSSPVSTSATDQNKIILIDATSGAITVNLLAAATAGDGFSLAVKKTDSTANAITIDANASETIDGATTISLYNQYDSVILTCDGSNWFIQNVPNTKRGAVNELRSGDVASATSTDIWNVFGNYTHITGTTTITGFGTAPQAGATRTIIFDGALTLTKGANLILPTGENITTAAGDVAIVRAETTTQHRVVSYNKASGEPLAPFGGFVSSQQTITSGGLLTLAHGLGERPLRIDTYLVCQTAENGYTAGDYVQISPASVGGNTGMAIVTDSTNVNVRYGASSSVFQIVNYTSGGTATATNANWNLVVVADV